MANNDKEQITKITDSLRSKSSTLVYGIPEDVSDQGDLQKQLLVKSMNELKSKVGTRTNLTPLTHFNEINFGKAYNEILKNNNKDTKDMSDADFKKMMVDNGRISVESLFAENQTRNMMYMNYNIIKEHIPECAAALQVYRDNIISPDDFTKLIFRMVYDKNDIEDIKDAVEQRLEDLSVKYEIETKTEEIIEQALCLGNSYVAVLSLDTEMNTLLNESISNGLSMNESISNINNSDPDYVSYTVLSESVNLNEETSQAFKEAFNLNEDEEIKEFVSSCVNNNIQIGRSRELLQERLEAEYSRRRHEVNNFNIKNKKKNNKDTEMYLNGSVVRYLDPSRLVDLTIDGICYGYYYAEDPVFGTALSQGFHGPTSGRDLRGSITLAQNNTIAGVGNQTQIPNNTAASQLRVSEQQLQLITSMFLNQISSKIDKEFVKKNKEFKDFIYGLLKQDYIVRRGIKLTYFKPDEVIHFKCKPLFQGIVFFAKLYLAILSNNIVIKMGRGHDKRLYYVNVGLDARYENAIQEVIENIKSKEFKLDNALDFNTSLSLAPGRMDDIFVPSFNGDRSIDIETLPGMDVDMNNDFMEFLRGSMLSGMDVPRNILDITGDVDFARSISTSNQLFVRAIIRNQKMLTPSFTRLFQKLYENEYKYLNNGKADNSLVDITSIKVQFPSPAALIRDHQSQEIQVVDQIADSYASTIVPLKSDGSTEDERMLLKNEIVKDMLNNVDWDKYEKMHERVKIKMQEDAISAPVPQDDLGMQDQYQY